MSTIGGVTPEPSPRWPVEEDWPGPWKTDARARGGCSYPNAQLSGLFIAANGPIISRSSCLVPCEALKRLPLAFPAPPEWPRPGWRAKGNSRSLLLLQFADIGNHHLHLVRGQALRHAGML